MRTVASRRRSSWRASPPIKTLAGFDFSFQPSLDKNRIMALAELGFIDRAEVLYLVGAPGSLPRCVRPFGPSHLMPPRRLASEYSSASEVVRAGFRALDREDAILEEALRDKVRASLADGQPIRPAEEVFTRLRAHHAAQVKAENRGS